jgi:SAM-dependent methyltransferase
MNSEQLFDEQAKWLNSTAGRYLQNKEQALFDQAIVDVFGFNALQMGFSQLDLLRNSRIPNRYLAMDACSDAARYQICCCDDFLPFAEQSLDLLLLPHRLEFSSRPHQTLREAERVLIHEGYLIISGFNPLSTWGLAMRLSRSGTYPWSGNFIGLARMKDWLTLLGFEIVSMQTSCSIPPFEKQLWHKNFSFMDKLEASVFCGVYFIVAKKRVAGMTPLKPLWSGSSLKAGLVARPTQKDVSPHSFIDD